MTTEPDQPDPLYEIQQLAARISDLITSIPSRPDADLLAEIEGLRESVAQAEASALAANARTGQLSVSLRTANELILDMQSDLDEMRARYVSLVDTIPDEDTGDGDGDVDPTAEPVVLEVGPAEPVVAFPTAMWPRGPIDDVAVLRDLELLHPYHLADHSVSILASGRAPVMSRGPDSLSPNRYLTVVLDREHASAPHLAASGHFYALGAVGGSRHLHLEADIAVLQGPVPPYARLLEAISWSGDRDDYPGSASWLNSDQGNSYGVRVVVWNNDDTGEPRLGLHLMHDRSAGRIDPSNPLWAKSAKGKLWSFCPSPSSRVTEVHSRTHHDGRSWVIDPDHRFVDRQWHHIALDLDGGDAGLLGERFATARLMLNGAEVIHVTGIPLVSAAGWTHAGVAAQIGGLDPSMVPVEGTVIGVSQVEAHPGRDPRALPPLPPR